jgi:hypothetical protein
MLADTLEAILKNILKVGGLKIRQRVFGVVTGVGMANDTGTRR